MSMECMPFHTRILNYAIVADETGMFRSSYFIERASLYVTIYFKNTRETPFEHKGQLRL